jgi:hypothetical protein
MSKRWSELAAFSLVIAAMVLAVACGGGGGGGGGGTGVVPTLAVTEDNVDSVAGASSGSTLSLMTAVLEAPVDKPGSSAAAGASVLGLLQDLLERFSKGEDAGSDVVLQDAMYVETVFYDLGGTATITLHDKDDSRDLSYDDRITAVYDQCREANTYIDGALTMEIDYLVRVDKTGYVDVLATVSVVNLVVGYWGQSRKLDGEYTVSMQITPDLGTLTATSYGSSLEVEEGVMNWTLKNFNLYYTSNTKTDSYMYTSAGGVDGDDLGGAVSFSTVIPFEGTTLEYPTTGSMQVLGSEGSRLTITAVDNAWVALSLDENGDGAPDFEDQITWVVLFAGD